MATISVLPQNRKQMTPEQWKALPHFARKVTYGGPPADYYGGGYGSAGPPGFTTNQKNPGYNTAPTAVPPPVTAAEVTPNPNIFFDPGPAGPPQLGAAPGAPSVPDPRDLWRDDMAEDPRSALTPALEELRRRRGGGMNL